MKRTLFVGTLLIMLASYTPKAQAQNSKAFESLFYPIVVGVGITILTVCGTNIISLISVGNQTKTMGKIREMLKSDLSSLQEQIAGSNQQMMTMTEKLSEAINRLAEQITILDQRIDEQNLKSATVEAQVFKLTEEVKIQRELITAENKSMIYGWNNRIEGRITQVEGKVDLLAQRVGTNEKTIDKAVSKLDV